MRVFFAFQRRAAHAGFAHFAKRSYANTKSKQKKGDPQSGALWATCDWCQKRGSAQTRFAQTARSPDPAFDPIHRPSQDGTYGSGCGEVRDPNPNPIAKIPSVCAEEHRARRIRDRDCLSAASSSGTPAGPSTAGCPKRRDADSRVAFSLVTFFWRSKRKLRAAGLPPACPQGNPTVEKNQNATN